MADDKDTPKKPEEILKDFLEIVDISKEQKEKLTSGKYEVDEVKDSFHETYIAKKMAGSDEDIRSRVNGETFRIIKKEMKDSFGLELSNSELDDKKWEDVFKLGIEKHGTSVKTLEEKVKSPTEGTEQITKLEEELKVANEKTATAIEESQKANKTLDEKQSEFDGKMKDSKIDMLVNNELSKLSFIDDITEIQKKGFNSIISDNYKFGLDDSGSLNVTDMEGNGVQNEKKSEMLSASEVLLQLATTNKLIKQNNGAPVKTVTPPVKTNGFAPADQTNGQAATAGPRLHTNTVKNTEQLDASQSSQ